jgi:hypothetical protein
MEESYLVSLQLSLHKSSNMRFWKMLTYRMDVSVQNSLPVRKNLQEKIEQSQETTIDDNMFRIKLKKLGMEVIKQFGEGGSGRSTKCLYLRSAKGSIRDS